MVDIFDNTRLNAYIVPRDLAYYMKTDCNALAAYRVQGDLKLEQFPCENVSATTAR